MLSACYCARTEVQWLYLRLLYQCRSFCKFFLPWTQSYLKRAIRLLWIFTNKIPLKECTLQISTFKKNGVPKTFKQAVYSRGIRLSHLRHWNSESGQRYASLIRASLISFGQSSPISWKPSMLVLTLLSDQSMHIYRFFLACLGKLAFLINTLLQFGWYIWLFFW